MCGCPACTCRHAGRRRRSILPAAGGRTWIQRAVGTWDVEDDGLGMFLRRADALADLLCARGASYMLGGEEGAPRYVVRKTTA
jgi:hypothetical protein